MAMSEEVINNAYGNNLRKSTKYLATGAYFNTPPSEITFHASRRQYS